MAVVGDLTKAELISEITDTAVATWWTNAPALPVDVDMVELFAKSLQAAYIAQVKKNAAGTPEAGESLNAYPQPATSNVTTDIETGIQSFTATYTVNAVFSVDNNLAVPAYI
ncbi:hypothetical protein WDZ92_06415 [Nostoc sp. NIES-2111]